MQEKFFTVEEAEQLIPKLEQIVESLIENKKNAMDIGQELARMEEKPLPGWLDYMNVHGLRGEAREKLARFRPATIGQAGRIAGINATDLSLVLVHLKSCAAA